MLLIEDMTYNAFVLNKNFRVKDERFHDILEWLHVCKARAEQALSTFI